MSRAPTMHVTQRTKRCGRPNCRCKTKGERHGPYWYGYWREGSQVRSIFIGRELPADTSSPSAIRIVRRWSMPDEPTLRASLRVLGIRKPEFAARAFRRLQKLYHPDRANSWPTGTTPEEAAAAIRAINIAHEFLFENWR